MHWKAARAKITAAHVTQAAQWIESRCASGDFANLYEETGCHPPRKRFVECDGRNYPAKAFGYLVPQKAGWDRREDYRPTVNEVVSPMRRFGIRDAA